MATWREMINEKLKENNDDWKNIEAITLTEKQLDVEFDDGYGLLPEGSPFCIWTKKYIYFPSCYDGAEYVESILRNPDKNPKPIAHIGGW